MHSSNGVDFAAQSQHGLLSVSYQTRSWLVLEGTANNLDLLSLDLLRIVQLEFDVLDDEGPDFVTEAVGVEMALYIHISIANLKSTAW